MNSNKIISREEVVFEIPPGPDDLRKMSLDDLHCEAINLGISREVIENIKDDL